ncbi:hypothetical protein H5410_023474 [Solanum commersonii]|uniref:Ubiquitin-like protease family profile domain-containing protein n=1 Tax=Solanum commersonii TaxID=4109 RepID=A0A9J5ZGZ2_SOLCO|nr:hypothetical protein H5410_023474 [Solanum commersonii]
MVVIPWKTVDNVLIPVNVKQMNHWVLIVLSLIERHIHVYDSYRAAGYDSFVVDKIQKLAHGLCRCICPCIMTITWTIRKI